MKPKWRPFLLLILIIIFGVCVFHLRSIPCKDYLSLIHDLLKISLSSLLHVFYLLLFLTGLGGLLITCKYFSRMKFKWLSYLRWILIPILISIITVCIYRLRKITIQDYLSIVGSLLLIFSCVVEPFLWLAGLAGLLIAFICLGILIFHWVFPQINVSYIIRPIEKNPSKTLKFKRFLIYFVSISWGFVFLCTFLHAWYQSFEVAMILLFLPFSILLIALDACLIFGIMQWNTLKKSGVNLVLMSIIMGLFTAYYFNGVMGEDQYIYNKFIDLRFHHDYPELIRLVKLDNSNNPNRKPVSDVLEKATVTSGKTKLGVYYIKIITGYRGMASSATAWGYVYVADNNLIGIPDALHWRKIIPCWYWVVFDY